MLIEMRPVQLSTMQYNIDHESPILLNYGGGEECLPNSRF